MNVWAIPFWATAFVMVISLFVGLACGFKHPATKFMLNINTAIAIAGGLLVLYAFFPLTKGEPDLTVVVMIVVNAGYYGLPIGFLMLGSFLRRKYAPTSLNRG